MLFSLTGCATIVSREYEDVEVIITREYYKQPWEEITLVANIPVTKTHDASYCISVKYMDKTYNLKDADTYARYTGKVGDTVIAVKEITTYDDGKTTIDITKLK